MGRDQKEIAEILDSAKVLAKRYRKLTGKPLGITGEVAEFSAAQILNLDLSKARQAGYDATRTIDGQVMKIQIKGRCMLSNAKQVGRIGKIKINNEWDTVLLVLMDEDLEVLSIHEAERSEIEKAIAAPGSKARTERGALSVNNFKKIGREIWNRKSI
ncbi:MAG: hypothetical protein KGM83_05810 [Betaproteobacteria bacterium]|nr:hypothetical protein [Betaproteobacteria bacterium]